MKMKFRIRTATYYFIFFAITQVCFLVYNIVDTTPAQPFVKTDAIWYVGEYVSFIAFHLRPLLFERKRLKKSEIFYMVAIVFNYVIACLIYSFGNPYDWDDIWIFKIILIFITAAFVGSKFTVDKRMIPIDEDEKDKITY